MRTLGGLTALGIVGGGGYVLSQYEGDVEKAAQYVKDQGEAYVQRPQKIQEDLQQAWNAATNTVQQSGEALESGSGEWLAGNWIHGGQRRKCPGITYSFTTVDRHAGYLKSAASYRPLHKLYVFVSYASSAGKDGKKCAACRLQRCRYFRNCAL